MTYDDNNSTDNSAHQNAKAQVREAYMLAFVPIVQEGMALLAEAIKDLRHEMALNRQEYTPLERELRVKQLKAALEDFDLDREEAKLNRAERAADREANKVERAERLKKFVAPPSTALLTK